VNREKNFRRAYAFNAKHLHGGDTALDQPEFPDRTGSLHFKLEGPIHEPAAAGGTRALQLKHCPNPPTKNHNGEVVPARRWKRASTEFKEERTSDQPGGRSSKRARVGPHCE